MTRLTHLARRAAALALLLSASASAQAHALPVLAHAAIIGGAPAPGGTLPSLAEIFDLRGRELGQCSGTVIAPSLVLTAGHCVVNMRTGVPRRASGFKVLTFDGAPASGEQQASTVSSVIVYEGFRRRVDDGDAALLVLSAPVSVPPIRLAAGSDHSELAAGTTATIAGWGKTQDRQLRLTEGLRSADTVVQAPRWCERNAPPFFLRGEICAIDPPSYVTGACNGDSGGPLLI